MELTRSKISVDKLLLRQKEGFLSVLPCGNNVFGAQYERVLPSSSAGNLYPLNYSGKTDSNGFYIGCDKFGANILVDFDKRTDDKANSNILMMPTPAHRTAITAEQIITPRKLLNSLIAASAGKIIRAEISIEPTRFIARTMISAVTTEISRL